jgi:hypothetical protein
MAEESPPTLRNMALRNLVLDVKRSNCDLFLNFCQFNDLINIQNDSFSQDMTTFYPNKTILEVVKEAKELFNCEVQFEGDETLRKVLGDEKRVKYILFCLVQTANIRSKQKRVRVSISIEKDESLVLFT